MPRDTSSLPHAVNRTLAGSPFETDDVPPVQMVAACFMLLSTYTLLLHRRANRIQVRAFPLGSPAWSRRKHPSNGALFNPLPFLHPRPGLRCRNPAWSASRGWSPSSVRSMRLRSFAPCWLRPLDLHRADERSGAPLCLLSHPPPPPQESVSLRPRVWLRACDPLLFTELALSQVRFVSTPWLFLSPRMRTEFSSRMIRR